MEENTNLIMTEMDYQKLLGLVRHSNSAISEMLEEELSRASIVPVGSLPADVVSMNSKIKFVDLETGKESVVTLVFPHEASVDENKISVMTPVGAALIGLRVGQTIDWTFPNGKTKEIKVVEVIYQPEAAGDEPHTPLKPS